MSNPAIELLIRSAESCENNAKIQQQEGDIDQASLNQANAVEYRAAIVMLNAALIGSRIDESDLARKAGLC